MVIKTKRKRSQKQENRVAKETHGRVTLASGALWISKGDVRTDEYLIECKTTLKKYYPLKFSTWFKIDDEACNDGFRIPVMCVDLEDGKAKRAIFKHSDFFETPVNETVKKSGLFYDNCADSVCCEQRKQAMVTDTDTIYLFSTFALCSCDWFTFCRRFVKEK